MKIPDELVNDAVDAWHDAGDVLLDDRLRAVIAVVRQKIGARLDELKDHPALIMYGQPCVECGEAMESFDRVTWRWRELPQGLVHEYCSDQPDEDVGPPERAEIRQQTIRDLHAGRIPLEEITAEQCRATCKFCDAPCEHGCHTGAPAGELPPAWVDQARDVARELLAAIEESRIMDVRVPPELARRIEVDPALFWLRGEERAPGTWTPPTTGGADA